jgi:hypothetical protein
MFQPFPTHTKTKNDQLVNKQLNEKTYGGPTAQAPEGAPFG